MATPGDTVPTTAYRLDRLERDLQTLTTRFESLQSQLVAKLDAIQATLGESRETMVDRYVRLSYFQERMNNLIQDTVASRKELERRIEEEVSDLREKRQEALASIDRRITKIEDSISWLTRVVIGAIISALVGGAIATLFLVARGGLKVV